MRDDGSRVGVKGIRKQINAWADRDTAFFTTNTKAWGHFRKLCIEDAPPEVKATARPTEPQRLRETATRLPAPEERWRLEDWEAEHPEGAQAYLANASKRRNP